MNTSTRPPLRHAACLAAFAAATAPLSAQVIFTGDEYRQNFDSLPEQTTGVISFTFENNSTLPGWYSTVGQGDTARASSGSRNGGLLYSWGPNHSANEDPDRALGLFAANGYAGGTAHLGLQVINGTGATLTEVTLTFDVEQWRRHTNHTTWTFSWLVTDATGNQLTTSGYTVDARGQVASLHAGEGSGLVGNREENRYSISFTLSGIDWGAGEALWLRWSSSQGNESAGLGLDNFRLTTASSIPEPGAAGLLAGLGAAARAFARRRR
jgi:hypothetical protein